MTTTTDVQRCDTDDCHEPATWSITGLGPNCSDPACCGWEEYACDDHKAKALSAMSPAWNLTARPYSHEAD